jgi:hypothetical protein
LDLHCQVDSYPVAVTTWYHNGTTLRTSSNVQISEDTTAVYILMVDFDNLGQYACVASNGYDTINVNGSISVEGLGECMTGNVLKHFRAFLTLQFCKRKNFITTL